MLEGGGGMTPANAAAVDSGADPGSEQRFSLREAARILEVPEARLRSLARPDCSRRSAGRWAAFVRLPRPASAAQHRGLLEPASRCAASAASDPLRDQLAAGAPLTSITIRAEGDEIVATDGSAAWAPDSGQFLLDLETTAFAEHARALAPPHAEAPRATANPGLIAAVEPRVGSAFADVEIVPTAETTAESGMSAEQWYELGLDLEGSSPLEAIVAYQQVLERDPGMTDACVNLGRLYHLTGERGRAEAQYRDAVRLAPDDPIPHFNLGVLLEEQGRRDEAAHAYAQAVARDPEFADAHCNLGLLLESMGRKQDAMRHLMTARELYRAEE
jgi:Flp pilus assembly protein TadD